MKRRQKKRSPGRPMLGREPTVKIGFTAPRDFVKEFRAAARNHGASYSEFFRHIFEDWAKSR